MEHNIKISDRDILEMDDNSGNISILSSNFPEQVSKNDVVVISFLEDTDDIQHKFIIDDVKDDVIQLEWKEMISSKELLTEGPVLDKVKELAKKTKDAVKTGLDDLRAEREEDKADKAAEKEQAKLAKADKKGARAAEKEQKTIEKSAKKSDKEDAKAIKDFTKLISRDLSEGRTWSFYIQLPDGKYLKNALTLDDVKVMYKDSKLRNLPAIVNAVVADRYGSVIRRGKEDVDMQGISTASSDAFKLTNGYFINWTKQSIQEFKEFLTSDAASQHLKDVVKASTRKQTTPRKKSEESPKTSTSTDDTKQTAVKKELTPAILKKFAKFIKLTGIQVLDDNMNRVTNVEKLTPESIADYWIVINGKEKSLNTWMKDAIDADILTESCSVRKVILEGKLFESPVVKLTDDDMLDPKDLKFSDKISDAMRKEAEEKAEAERIASLQQYKEKYLEAVEFVEELPDDFDLDVTAELLFDLLVPESGIAPTVGGELVRAVARLSYRDFNDGDKFFMGYGLETCAPSAAYLADNGFDSQIHFMIEDSYRLADDDDKYTQLLNSLTRDIINHLRSNTELIYTPNTTDSREYDADSIIEAQPRYEFEIPTCEEIEILTSNSVVTSWQLNEYVEEHLEWNRAFEGAEVDRPWSTYSSSVTVSNLTADGLSLLQEDTSDPEAFWGDFISEYEEELSSAKEDDSEEDDEE